MQIVTIEALRRFGAGEVNRTLVIITKEDSWGNSMNQRRKSDETAPFQTTLRTWSELLTTEYHSRPHHGAITKGRGLRNRPPRIVVVAVEHAVLRDKDVSTAGGVSVVRHFLVTLAVAGGNTVLRSQPHGRVAITRDAAEELAVFEFVLREVGGRFRIVTQVRAERAIRSKLHHRAGHALSLATCSDTLSRK